MNDYSVIDLLENYKLNQSKLLILNSKQTENKELVDLKEKVERLNFCINCLPDEEKEVIKQIYVNGLSFRKTGKVLMMSRTTVYRKIKKAVEMLEELVKTMEK